ncbi:hypothetical protein ZOSMA_122G00570 [Zostera marina]|uniref:Wall-associated receptor kinase galacturonan-binding domain-containing protein n=1 Tax=Zostera marina TaxID=29655 RepID=A0A0K9Q0W8_ZOSMR|nr:hypothetical protein ZOSMA_122G00570 [Zostera marina]
MAVHLRSVASSPDPASPVSAHHITTVSVSLYMASSPFSIIVIVLLSISFLIPSSSQSDRECGEIPIHFPFSIDDGCGSPYYRRLLFCSTATNTLHVRTPSGVYPVQNISYSTDSSPHLIVSDPSMFSSCNSTYSSRWVPRNRNRVPRNRNQNRDRLSRLVISVEVEGRVISVGGGEQRFPIGLHISCNPRSDCIFEFELQSPWLVPVIPVACSTLAFTCSRLNLNMWSKIGRWRQGTVRNDRANRVVPDISCIYIFNNFSFLFPSPTLSISK